MDQNYTIEEILSAVSEIQNKKLKKKTKVLENKIIKKDYSKVPQNTLNLIEEAEKTKN